MGKKKIKEKSNFLSEPFDFENAVRVRGKAPSRSQAHQMLREKAANKVLKSVRYDADLLDQVQKIAKAEGIPYQTLMNSLLKSGIESRKSNIIDRLEKIEAQVFKKNMGEPQAHPNSKLSFQQNLRIGPVLRLSFFFGDFSDLCF